MLIEMMFHWVKIVGIKAIDGVRRDQRIIGAGRKSAMYNKTQCLFLKYYYVTALKMRTTDILDYNDHTDLEICVTAIC